MIIYIVEIVRHILEDGTEVPARRMFNNEQKAREIYNICYIELDYGIIRLIKRVDGQEVIIKEDNEYLF